MPFISEQQLERVQAGVASMHAKARKFAEEKKEAIETTIMIGEVVGSAAAMGFIRGKYEKDGSKFVIPGTPIDIQAVTGAGLLALGVSGMAGAKYDSHLTNVGMGLLAGYAQDVFRNYGKAGTFDLVAGSPMLVSGSHLGHQFGHPNVGAVAMNDVLRSALSAS